MGFKDDFIWGAAAASYQIEGSTQGVDGCAESVWDMCCRKKDFVKGGNHGFVACDHYNRYKEDVAIMKEIGLQAYRLSIMWPRVMPEGVGAVNQKGLDFYDRLIDELLAAGITPWITLFHWDYPLALFNRGGWLNPDSPEWFADYSKVIVDKFSDRVSNWFTLNEPECFIGLGHQTGMHAPGLQLPTREVNLAWHNSLIAHGRAVQVIRANAKSTPRIGAAPTFAFFSPHTDSPEDIEAARQQMFCVDSDQMFNASWWLDPAFFGRYPEDGLKLHGENAPVFTDEQMKIISEPVDFLGCNLYTSRSVRAGKDGKPEIVEYPNDYPNTFIQWAVRPDSLRWASKFLYERYNKPIVVTENGLSLNDWVGVDGKVHDPKRIDFLTRYLRGLRQAADEGVDVMGYFQWSIMDNFEWAQGYFDRFGIVHVDYATQKRTIKDSGHWYKTVIESNGGVLGDGTAIDNWREPADFDKNISVAGL